MAILPDLSDSGATQLSAILLPTQADCKHDLDALSIIDSSISRSSASIFTYDELPFSHTIEYMMGEMDRTLGIFARER